MLHKLRDRALRTRTPRCSVDGAPTWSHYTLFDLLCVGVGATVGSGVFVVTGQVAHDITGPSVIVSWLISGVACCLSAMAYAELTCKWPGTSCSSYSFVYALLGEWPAVLTAWALSLECGISAAAVARGWGAKVSSLLDSSYEDTGFNIYAFTLQLLVVGLFLRGVEISKRTVNIFTVLKTFIVCFMIVAGLLFFESSNLAPFSPTGWSGIMRGTTTCFFGYLGYDEVCCLTQETKHPLRDIPLAIFGTILCAAVLYSLSSLALVGMADYSLLDTHNSFYSAFSLRNQPALAGLVSAGELCTMPLVVMASFLPQPRILYAMARDRLVPRFLASCDDDGNLRNAIALSGAVCVVIAALVPYQLLNNLVSGGVLLAFNLTNACLILLRLNTRQAEAREGSPPVFATTRCEALLLGYCALCGGLAVAQSLCAPDAVVALGVLEGCLLAAVAVAMYFSCTPVEEADQRLHASERAAAAEGFRTPLVPFVPLGGIWLNTHLLVQLSSAEIRSMIALFALATLLYALQILLMDTSPDTEADDARVGSAAEACVLTHGVALPPHRLPESRALSPQSAKAPHHRNYLAVQSTDGLELGK